MNDTSRTTADKAVELQRLHSEPELLVLINVWDVITARTVADVRGTRALATASHSVAASAGYPDGEVIPVDEMLAAVGRIAGAVALPVTADLGGWLRRRGVHGLPRDRRGRRGGLLLRRWRPAGCCGADRTARDG